MSARAWQYFYMIIWAAIILSIAGCGAGRQPQPQELFEQIPNHTQSTGCCGGKLVCESHQSRYCY